MEEATTRIEKITIAVFKEADMVFFYEKVFNIQFTTLQYPGFNLSVGDWSGIEIQFCPAAIAKNTATHNRHQFHIKVNDIETVLKNVQKYGGSTMEDLVANEEEKIASIKDPDANTIVLLEKII